MADPRFGEGFPQEFDATNRRTPFREQQHTLPHAEQVAVQAREALKLDRENWPEPPETETVEDFFNAARATVTERWRTQVTPLIEQLIERWLSAVPDNEDTQGLRTLLSNQEVLDQKMAMQQMGAFEDLKNFSPEAWCTIMLLSSERQLAAVALTREWIQKMDEGNFEKFGLQKSEMETFIELAAVFGKYIDSAYVRQIEFAATPGGDKTSPLSQIEKAKAAREEASSERGIDRIYDLQRSSESDEIDIKTYSEVFPDEWPKIVSRFRAIAEKIRTNCTAEKLPQTYLRFANYLDKMAVTYGSASLSPEELYIEWQDLMRESQELAESEFPLMVVPQGCATVAGDANKVDVEIRLGMRTKETK